MGIFAITNVNPHYEKLADPSMMKVIINCIRNYEPYPQY